jgi:hypothetical protein
MQATNHLPCSAMLHAPRQPNGGRLHDGSLASEGLSRPVRCRLAVADPESFLWVDTQYRNIALQFATVLRYLSHRESRVVLGLPKTLLGPPLQAGACEKPNSP